MPLARTAFVLALLAAACAPRSGQKSLFGEGFSEQTRRDSEAACAAAEARRPGVESSTRTDGSVASGTIRGNATDCFTGTTRSYTDPHTGRSFYVWDEGVFAATNWRDRTAGPTLYEGTFLALSGTPHDGYPRLRYVFAGRRISDDGTELTGIFVTETNAEMGFPEGIGRKPPPISSVQSRFVRADRAYVARLEAEHREEVEQYKREQARRARRRGNINWGQIAAFGLGNALIASSGLPAEQTAELMTAYSTDVLTNGQAGAMDELTGGERGAATSDPGGGTHRMTCFDTRMQMCGHYTFSSKGDYDSFWTQCEQAGSQISDGHTCNSSWAKCSHSTDAGRTVTTFVNHLDDATVRSHCDESKEP